MSDEFTIPIVITSTLTPLENPGSKEAVAAGCKCPVIDNHYGRGIRDDGKQFVISGLCPLHGNEKKISNGSRSMDYWSR